MAKIQKMKHLIFFLFNLFLINTILAQNFNGLVAAFPLDNDVNDYSPYNINGVNYNAIPVTNGGRDCHYFNGYNAYIYAGNNSRGIVNEVTVVAWVKTTSDKLQWIVGHYDHNFDKGYQLVMDNGFIEMRGRETSNTFYILSSDFTINDGTWHFIGAIYDHNSWTLTIDCRFPFYLTTNSPNPIYTTTTQPFSISKFPELNNGIDPMHFDGYIDDILVFNRALSYNELCALYGTGQGVSEPLIEKNLDLNIFPNPVKDKLNINLSIPATYTFDIYDSLGRLVFHSKELSEHFVLDVNNWTKGVYTLKVMQNNKVSFYKFIKN